jgi:hypothetical protein
MSNTQTNARQSGSSRRRGSRGGRGRQHGQGGGTRTAQRNEEPREGGQASPRRRRSRKPQLKWWQKLLKAIGLYREPKRERKPRTEAAAPVKSNTRTARTQEGSGGARGGTAAARGGDATTVKSGRLYVGNLSYDATEHDLQELFKGIATVRSVEVVYNRKTHRSKGYGFVEMLNREDALRAVEVLHDQPFMGRKMIVSGADSKGRDSREDREESTGADERAVVVAPVPASKTSASAQSSDGGAQEADPVIPTVVETEVAAADTESSAPVQLEFGAAEVADDRERTTAS